MEGVAIIGMSGVFPSANNIDELYDNLSKGTDCIKQPSQKRLINSSADLSLEYKSFGYLDRVDLFDHNFFNISKKEADFIDPSHRLLLQQACLAIENSGYSLDDFNGSNTALILAGKTFPAYALHCLEEQSPFVATGNLQSMGAGRIAYYLNLKGPTFTIDTACSSSLLAVHEACKKVERGEVDYALAGAVNVAVDLPVQSDREHTMGIESVDGRCKAFDADADGVGGGEGGGVVLLKRLEKAIEDGDVIHSVIINSRTNHDGNSSNGLTAPSPTAQAELLKATWSEAGIEPESIGYIEAHGSGTKLGDPIEFQAITDAFKSFGVTKKTCGISSIKTNIGHLDSGAGIAGLIKATLALKNGVQFPSVHFNEPNPFIDFDNSPAFVNCDFKEWKKNGLPRRCGVSSFGLSGSNAHILLEEPPLQNQPTERGQNGQEPSSRHILKVSAKSATAHQALLKEIQETLQQTPDNLENLLYTLNIGRPDYDYRLGIGAQSKDELINKIKEVRGLIQKDPTNLFVPGNKDVILLISDDSAAGWNIETHEYLKNDLTVRGVIKKIESLKTWRNGSEDLKKFVAQYAITSHLQAMGITFSNVIANGVGRITKRVVFDALPLSEALELIEKGGFSAEYDEMKFRHSVTALKAGNQAIFADLGGPSVLGKALNNILTEEEKPTLLFSIEENPSDLLVDFYNRGIKVDWRKYYRTGPTRTEAPGYTFDQMRCWFKPPSTVGLDHSQKDIHYDLKWVRQGRAESEVKLEGKSFLMFLDQEGLANVITPRLVEAGNSIITVSFSNNFKKESNESYQIDPSSEEDYQRLAEDLESNGTSIDGIFHLTGFTKTQTTDSSLIEQELNVKVYPLFFALRAFKTSVEKQGFELLCVTSNSSKVDQSDGVAPFHTAAAALVRGVLSEYPISMNACTIDLSPEEDIEQLSDLVYQELTSERQINFIAYRNSQRYVQELYKIYDLKEATDFELRKGGTYLITGGLGDIGLNIALSMAERQPVHLILTGRSPFPKDEQNPKIEKLKQIEALNSTVEYFQVDVSEHHQMEKMFTDLHTRSVKIDGIVHAAGLGISNISLQQRSFEDFQEVLKPKIHGTILLTELSQRCEPEFILSFSSLNALVPKKNSVDYTIACAFEDAFVDVADFHGPVRYLSVDWPDWYTGPKIDGMDDSGLALKPITMEYGIWAFYKILSAQRARRVLADTDFEKFAVNPYFLIEGIVNKYSGQEKWEEQHKELSIQLEAKGFTETQSEVAAVWTQVLGNEALNLDDDFYALGGHSLNCAQVINRMDKLFGVKIDYKNLLTYSTIRELTKFVEELQYTGQVIDHLEIMALEERDYYDISHAQKRLWIACQSEERRAAYNIPMSYVFSGGFKPEVFKSAFDWLIDRHESLRTIFLVVEGEPRQKVLSSEGLGFSIEYVDLTNEQDAERIVEQRVQLDAEVPFDLETGPLIRAQLLHLKQDEYVFVYCMHHIISDGWSIGLLINEILTTYNHLVEGTKNPLKPLQVQYRDYAYWHNRQLSGENLELHQNYWHGRFGDELTRLEFPTDYDRADATNFKGEIVDYVLDKEEGQQFKDICKKHEVSLFMGLAAVSNVLLQKYTGERDITIGFPIANREHISLEDQIGFFVNTIPLRTIVNGSDSFINLLEKVKDATLGAYKYQSYPFDCLVDDLALKYEANRPAMFDVMIMLQNMDVLDDHVAQMSEVSIEPYANAISSSKYDLKFAFFDLPDTIAMRIEYNVNLFKPSTIDFIKENFMNILHVVNADIQIALADVKMILPEELEAEQQDFLNMMDEI